VSEGRRRMVDVAARALRDGLAECVLEPMVLGRRGEAHPRRDRYCAAAQPLSNVCAGDLVLKFPRRVAGLRTSDARHAPRAQVDEMAFPMFARVRSTGRHPSQSWEMEVEVGSRVRASGWHGKRREGVCKLDGTTHCVPPLRDCE